jgi:hypothetical protein
LGLTQTLYNHSSQVAGASPAAAGQWQSKSPKAQISDGRIAVYVPTRSTLDRRQARRSDETIWQFSEFSGGCFPKKSENFAFSALQFSGIYHFR